MAIQRDRDTPAAASQCLCRDNLLQRATQRNQSGYQSEVGPSKKNHEAHCSCWILRPRCRLSLIRLHLDRFVSAKIAMTQISGEIRRCHLD